MREPTNISSLQPLSPNWGLFHEHWGRAKSLRASFPCWKAPGCSQGAVFPSRHWEKLLSSIKYLGFMFVGGQKERSDLWQRCTH